MNNDKKLEEITWAYAAKNFAKGLTVTIPKIPLKNKIGLTIAYFCSMENIIDLWENWRNKNDNHDEDIEDMIKKEEEYFKSNGLNTETERYAHTIAEHAGLYLSRSINHNSNRTDELNLTKTEFNKYLQSAVECGIQSLTGQFLRISLDQHVVNEDFEQKAYYWLKDEAHSKLAGGKELILLERAIVKEEKGIINLKPYYN